MKNGYRIFISIEGPEGSGKSTQIEKLRKTLLLFNYKCYITREPGGTILGETIRKILKYTSNNLSKEAELFLFIASRAQLIKEIMSRDRHPNEIIIFDRFVDSTIIYQCYAKQVNKKLVETINYFILKNVIPILSIIIDIPSEVIFQRINKRKKNRGNKDRIENKGLIFHQKIREGYFKISKIFSKRFIVINGKNNEKAIKENIWNEIKKRLC